MANQTTSCKYCAIVFTYDDKSSTGKFCSNSCCGKFKSEVTTKARIEKGLVRLRSTLKRYLQRERGDCCSVCGLLPVWNEKPLSLQVDHIDGNSDNNMPENLRLICPNCHTQTETFTGRNKKPYSRNKYMREYRKRGIS